MKIPTAKKLPSGRWRVQIMVDGDRLSITADTKKECERKAVAIKAGLTAAQSRSELPLREAVENYIAAKESVLSPSTIAGYRFTLKNRFQSIMDVDIYKLTNRQLQRAVASESREVGPKTVKNTYSLIHATLDYYHVHPDDVTLPQTMRHDAEHLQLDEIPKLVVAVRGDSCEVPILMALLMGMRRSEILGLCWDCVDLEHRKLEIRRTYVQKPDSDWTLKETTKNSTSQRTLRIDAHIMPLLTGGTGRVCPVSVATLREHLKAACRRADVTMTTLHGLRHTWAAWMASLGIDERVIIKLGGWSKGYTLKSVYDYVFDAEIENAENRIDDYFAHDLHTEI